MKTFIQLMLELRTTAEQLLKAVRETGLHGKMVGTARMWNAEEVETLRKHLNGSK